MRVLLFIFTFFMYCAPLSAQYSYFNQITGSLTDNDSESSSNVEVIDEGYVIWNGGVNAEGILYHFVRKYSLEGVQLNENILIHPNEYVLSGLTNSFNWNPEISRSVFIGGSSLSQDTLIGYLIEFDENLDTTFTKRYLNYPTYTYPFLFEVVNDGYIVAGQNKLLSGISTGTFLMKLDFQGNIIWSETLHSEQNEQYRNHVIIKFDTGYCIAGGKHISANSKIGTITTTNLSGELLTEKFVLDEDEFTTSQFSAGVKLNNGEILLGSYIGYADVAGNTNPDVYWNKVRLSKFNPEINEIYWQQDYHDDFEMILGRVEDMEATPDGGAIVMGGRSGEFYDYYTWLMKVDEDGNEEWFQEYTYENCNDCWNEGGDVELTADGGYIIAGKFANYSINNPRNSTWLVKVDACGDTEWVDCVPVGVEEKEPQSFSVYPNPSEGRFTVATETQNRVVAYSVYDLSGRNLDSSRLRSMADARLPNSSNEQFEINLNLPTGLYALELMMDDGKRENHKIQVVR